MKVYLLILILALSYTGSSKDYEQYLKLLLANEAYIGESYGMTIKEIEDDIRSSKMFESTIYKSKDSLKCIISNGLYNYKFQVNYKLSGDSLWAIPVLISYVYDSTNFINSSIERNFRENNEQMISTFTSLPPLWKKVELENLVYQDEMMISNAKRIEISKIGDTIPDFEFKQKKQLNRLQKDFMTKITEDPGSFCEFDPYLTIKIIGKNESCEMDVCFSCQQIMAKCSNGKLYSYVFDKPVEVVEYFNELYPSLKLSPSSYYKPEIEILKQKKILDYLQYMSDER